VVLYSIKENDFHGDFKVWKNVGIAVYVPKETILKELTANIEEVKPAFLFCHILVTLQYTLQLW
jgi:hypothetical protein